MSENKFQHGVTVEDKITGLKGVVTGHADYITGCDQYLVVPRIKSDGNVPEARWFDENRLELVSNENIINIDNSNSKPGADISAPIK